jgi:hypothetical protein
MLTMDQSLENEEKQKYKLIFYSSTYKNREKSISDMYEHYSYADARHLNKFDVSFEKYAQFCRKKINRTIVLD